jgi:hypothetical protein
VNDTLSSVAEDSGARTILASALLANDGKGPANESGQALTITGVSNAIGGMVSLVSGYVRFTPSPNFNGAASFDYAVTDNGSTIGGANPKSATGHVTFAVTPVNDAPANIALSAATAPENSVIGTTVGTLSATDVEGNVITYSLVNTVGGRFGVNGT